MSAQNPFVLQKEIKWGTVIFFVILHALLLLLIWLPMSWKELTVAFGLYLLMGFGITAGYHRYFAHRTYQTGRVFQFILAWLGSMTFQKILPWAAQHRHHHRSSDTEEDFHSPIRGFLWAHMLWMFHKRDYKAIEATVPDLSTYPEIRWINKWTYIAPITTIALCYAIGGWSMVIGGFVLATVFTWHVMLSINSLTHLMGSRRYVTTDTSKNSLLLALLAFGEGWHNNHHYFSTSTRQGFKWWEIDLSYYVLSVLSWFGVVRNMRSIPAQLENRNLVADGHVDIGEAHAATLRMNYLGRPKLLPKVLTHTTTIAGATALLTLLVVFASMRANAYVIVGSAVFGSTLLAFFILHIWRAGLSRNNLYLLSAGAVSPLIIMMGSVTAWAWMILASMWVAIGGIILARHLKTKTRLLEHLTQITMSTAALIATYLLWHTGFVTSTHLLYAALAVTLFAGAYQYRYFFDTMRLQPLFQLVLLGGSTSYYFFLTGLI